MPAVRGRPSSASRNRFGAQVFALVLLHALLMPGANADSNAQGACPPPYRRGSPDLPAAKAAKKGKMRQRGFPERLISLIDRLECVACVETAPDAFSILVVYKEEFAPRPPTVARFAPIPTAGIRRARCSIAKSSPPDGSRSSTS